MRLRLGLVVIFHVMCIGLCAGSSEKIQQLEARLQSEMDVEEEIDLRFELSELLIHVNREESIQQLHTALVLAEDNSDHEMVAKIQGAIGRVLLDIGEREKALLSLDLAVEIASREGLKEVEAHSRIGLGYYWYRTGDSAKTISNYEKAFDLFSELEDTDGIAESYLKLGWGYYIFGNYELSGASFEKSLAMHHLIESDTTLIVNILMGAGSFNLNQSIKQHHSIQYFEKALDLSIASGDKFSEGRCYNALGFLYASLNNYPVAESFYLQGLEMFEEMGNQAELVWLYTQIGEMHTAEKNFDKALQQFENALLIVDEIDAATIHKTTIYSAIGTVHKEKGEDYELAIDYFQDSKDLATSVKNNYQILDSELNIGECYVELKQFEKGKKWCKSVYDKNADHFQLRQKTCECLYRATAGLEQYEESLVYFEQFKMHTDSLHMEELSDKINNLAAKQTYEMELAEVQKAQEIEAINSRAELISWAGGIGFLALLAIMFLSLSNIKKTAQKEQLQAISNVRQEMIANVSHDLQTPITVITGYAETLLMRPEKNEPKDQEKYLNIILENANRLSTLIKQLFIYTKLEAKQIEPNKAAFQLSEVLDAAYGYYQLIAKKKGVEIKLDYQENMSMVYADRLLIDRVMQNLMDNAIKFTPQNGLVTVSLKDNGDKVQMTISDTGKGIPEEMKTQVFERHEKSLRSPGAGLGLAIVKKIIEIHDSEIHVESRINEGASFSFSLAKYRKEG